MIPPVIYLLIAAIYPILQGVALEKCRRDWKFAARIPFVILVIAFIFSVFALIQGSNLWPFSLILSSFVSSIYLIFLLTAKAILNSRPKEPPPLPARQESESNKSQ